MTEWEGNSCLRCRCGFENAPDAKFCGNCRSPLVDELGSPSATGSTSVASGRLPEYARPSTVPGGGKAGTTPRSRTVTAIVVIGAVTAGCWWLLRADIGPSRVDQVVDRIYWIDGSFVVEPGTKNAAERFTVQASGRIQPLVEGCYTSHFQLADGSVVYSLIDCDFKSATVYHWRPGYVPRELHKVTRKADWAVPTLTFKRLGASNRVLISEDRKEPLLFDAATQTTRTLTQAASELVKRANANIASPETTWTWFEDVAFNSDEQGTELIYTRCSGDDYRPSCATFKQSIEPEGAPDVLRGPDGQAIVPVLRRGPYLFCTVGGEVSSVYRLDLQSLTWRPVVATVSQVAFSPDGTKLAVADLHPNVLMLTYNEASGTFAQPRRLTNFPGQRSYYHLDLAWLNDAALVIRVEIDGSFAGGWRADLGTGSLDLLWQSRDATQDVFFDYVRKQKGQTTYSVRIPRSTRITDASARLIAKTSVIVIGLLVLASVVIVGRRSRPGGRDDPRGEAGANV